MDRQRRSFLTLSGAASALAATSGRGEAAGPAASPPLSALGLDAAQLGVRPGSPDDQSAALQRAIDHAAQLRVPLALAPGVYRAAGLRLPSGAKLVGVRGATVLQTTAAAALLTAVRAEDVALSGLTLQGFARTLPPNQGLIDMEDVGVRIADCAIQASGRHGIRLSRAAGEIAGTTITDAADVALMSSDARGLTIRGNTITNAGNNGIQILRSAPGTDGTFVLDNRIDDTRNRDGGTGPFGNAINVFRAGDVIVRGNLIRRCAFSGIRGNSASNLQIVGNTVHAAGETALYSEFAFETAIVANNIVDGAQIGVSIANFNEGGRLAMVQGNILRNIAATLRNTAPDDFYGVGIYAEADTVVSANVVENAETAAIALGWGSFLRNVAVTGNVVRKAGIGVAVSVVPGAGATLIATNVLAQCSRGAIVGMDHARPVTGDLARDGGKLHAHLSIADNRAG
jgi:uncharacterized secreted repeat protein (TIGR03808 family)